MENYHFVKEFDAGGFVVPEGTDLSIVNGVVYYNGGILMDIYQNQFRKLVVIEKKNGWNYLRPYKPLYNKV